MVPHTFIENYELVIDRFGKWPSFHDAEIHRIALERPVRGSGDYGDTSIELEVRTWKLTNETDESGYLLKKAESIISFRFLDIVNVELKGFNHQNVLGGIYLEILQDVENGIDSLTVELEPCFGLYGSFTAGRAYVTSVKPFQESA